MFWYFICPNDAHQPGEHFPHQNCAKFTSSSRDNFETMAKMVTKSENSEKGRISVFFERFISPPGEIVTEFRPRENDRNHETVLGKKQKAVFSRPGIRGTVFLY